MNNSFVALIASKPPVKRSKLITANRARRGGFPFIIFSIKKKGRTTTTLSLFAWTEQNNWTSSFLNWKTKILISGLVKRTYNAIVKRLLCYVSTRKQQPKAVQNCRSETSNFFINSNFRIFLTYVVLTAKLFFKTLSHKKLIFWLTNLLAGSTSFLLRISRMTVASMSLKTKLSSSGSCRGHSRGKRW